MNKEQLRTTLVRELVAAGEAARTAAENDTDLSQRVHRFRKALRRARATLNLVAKALPPRAVRTATRALRDARRALSDARDYTVVPHVVGSLPLDDAHRGAITELLVAASGQAPDPIVVEQTLRAGASTSVAEIRQISGQIPGTFGWSVPRDGLRRIYREAREARLAAKHDLDAFHTWRRRTKELSYQLDLLTQLYPNVAVYAQALEPLIDTQSVAVDLMMLGGFLRKHGEAVAPNVLSGAASYVEQQTAAHMKLARRAGRDHFSAKSKDYVQGIHAAIISTTT